MTPLVIRRLAKLLIGAAAVVVLQGTAVAQSRTAVPVRAARSAELPLREQLNAWTLGLAGGLLEGAPIRFATEIARVVDDGENLHVLPIVTRGPSENLEALLYLRGVDVAVINSDSLEEFR